MDKVSIIIPVYNSENYLDKCILSLLNQSFKNNEYIFVNDGSEDDSLKILKDYSKEDSRIIVIDKQNTGVSDTRNQGIKKASGDYVCFCDADDTYDTHFVEYMLDAIKEKNTDAVRCNYNVYNFENKLIGKGNHLEGNYTKDDILNDILRGNIPAFTPLLLIKKDRLTNLFPSEISMMEDIVFYTELLLNIDTIYCLNKYLYNIVFNEEGATNNSSNFKNNILNVVKVNEYIGNLLGDKFPKGKENINVNNLNAIADFVFKDYLANNHTINLCISLRDSLIPIIEETDLNNLNFSRKIIFKLLIRKHYFLLGIYFMLRKIIYKLKRLGK